MSVLITGATGYLGSYLTKALIRSGEDVHVVHRPDSNLSQFQGINVTLHAYDVSCGSLNDILARSGPRLIYHLAAHYVATHVQGDINPLVVGNIEFGTQLFQAMAEMNHHRIVVAGTVWQHFSDNNHAPATLYAAMKEAQARILHYYADAFGFSSTQIFLADTYGPRDPRRRIFTILREAAKTGEILALSPGAQLLDLVYIDDVIDSLLTAGQIIGAETSPSYHTWLVKAARRHSLREVVELWQSITGRRVNLAWGGRPYRPREVMIPWQDAPLLPGWNAKIGLEDGIRLMESLNV